MKRNDVVVEKSNYDFVYYSRIIKSLPNNEYVIIDSSGDKIITHESNLELSDYKGYWTFKITKRGRIDFFVPMSSIKRLKQKYNRMEKFKKDRGL